MRTRTRWVISFGLLGAVAAFAIARTAPTATPPAPTAPPASAAADPTARAAPRPAPAAPEETATLHDDPTVAPDSQESADNAVTFPSDI
jgi:hypothetical protein